MKQKGILLAIGTLAVFATASVVIFRGPDSGAGIRKFSERTGLVFGGIPAEIRLYAGGPEGQTAALVENAWRVFEGVGPVFNAFDPKSETSMINADGSTTPIPVSDEFKQVFGISADLWAETGGAFDVTSWPLKMLYRESERNNSLPSKEQIEGARERVGLAKSAILGGFLRRSVPGIGFDFGGLVKGWAVDKATALAVASGAQSGLVRIGGEIRTFGTSPEGGNWKIGIQDPLEHTAIHGVIETIGDVAISTSGNYEQGLVINGKKVHHIVDPISGETANTDVLGVTVVVMSGENKNARADGLATAMTVLGPIEGLKVVGNMTGVEVLFIISDGSEIEDVTTPGWGRDWKYQRIP